MGLTANTKNKNNGPQTTPKFDLVQRSARWNQIIVENVSL
jgi:hypothetical protein